MLIANLKADDWKRDGIVSAGVVRLYDWQEDLVNGVIENIGLFEKAV